ISQLLHMVSSHNRNQQKLAIRKHRVLIMSHFYVLSSSWTNTQPLSGLCRALRLVSFNSTLLGSGVSRNRRRTEAATVFTIISAKRAATQFRGPMPNGKKSTEKAVFLSRNLSGLNSMGFS
ncbi:hypothetical protein PFISCL1PPCAC_9486, partial [Pristionchus fissidentatus]